jgi:hypothetical protein
MTKKTLRGPAVPAALSVISSLGADRSWARSVLCRPGARQAPEPGCLEPAGASLAGERLPEPLVLLTGPALTVVTGTEEAG